MIGIVKRFFDLKRGLDVVIADVERLHEAVGVAIRVVARLACSLDQLNEEVLRTSAELHDRRQHLGGFN